MESFGQLRQRENELQDFLRQEDVSPEARERALCMLHAIDCGSVTQACERYGIARQTFYSWVKKFDPRDLHSLDDLPPVPKTKRQREVDAATRAIIVDARRELRSRKEIEMILGGTVSAATITRVCQDAGVPFVSRRAEQREHQQPVVHAVEGIQLSTTTTIQRLFHQVRTVDGPSWSSAALFIGFVVTALLGGLATPIAHAAEGSVYRMYGDFDQYSNKNAQDGSTFKANEAGTTDFGKPMQGSRFQIVNAPPAASSSPSAAAGGDTGVGGGAGDTGGGRRPCPLPGSGPGPCPAQPPAPSTGTTSSVPSQSGDQPSFIDGKPDVPLHEGAPLVPTKQESGAMPLNLEGKVSDHPAAESVDSFSYSSSSASSILHAVDPLKYQPRTSGAGNRILLHTVVILCLIAGLIAFIIGFILDLWYGNHWKKRNTRYRKRSKHLKRTSFAHLHPWVFHGFIGFVVAASLLVLSLWFIPVALSATTTPLTHTYHGHLLDTSGNAVTTAHTIRFSYWKSADFVSGDLTATGAINTGATNYASWYEEQTVTPNSQGYFSLKLGSVTTLPTMDALAASTLLSLHLQVEVKVSGAADSTYDLLDTNSSSATEDRAAVLSVPFAANADKLDQRDVGTGSGSIPVLQSGGLLPVSTTPGGTNRTSFALDADGATSTGTLLFGGNLTEYLRYNNALNRFEFSDALWVEGNLSTSGSLIVEGAVTFGSTLRLNNVTYTFPRNDGSASGYVLRTNGSGGQLSWGPVTAGNGSGNIIFLNPVYSHAVYFGSGSYTAGQLTNNYDVTNNKDFYRWTTAQSTLNDYWISVQVRLPNNFSSWDPVKPIEFRYRTTGGSTSDQYLTVRMRDTSSANVSLTGATLLTSASWTTANITGPEASGTFTPGQYITIFVRLAAKAGFNADAGYINLNFETTTP